MKYYTEGTNFTSKGLVAVLYESFGPLDSRRNLHKISAEDFAKMRTPCAIYDLTANIQYDAPDFEVPQEVALSLNKYHVVYCKTLEDAIDFIQEHNPLKRTVH